MHRCCHLIALTLLSLTIAAGASPARAENPAPVAKIDLQDGDCLVFLGDSITHQRLYTQYVEDYFYTRFPTRRIRFHNAGVGGARAWDALQRFDRDVAQYKPKYVTVLLGMNDGSYQPYNDAIFQTYKTDMLAVIAKIKEAGSIPVLMTPTMYDSRAARILNRPNTPPERLELYNSVLAYYGTWLREVSVENGMGFVDMWSRLNNITLEQRKQNADFTLIKDAVHPDAPGQLVMAVSIIEDMGLPRPLSNIVINLRPAEPAVRAVGGAASEVQKNDDGVQFTWLADGLPWVVPADAEAALKLTNLGHRLSREALQIHGLAPGQYELTIDDTVVGKFFADQLAAHIELQERDTPEHKQAADVAALNKQKSEGPISALRGEWSLFQQYARFKQQLEATPDDEAKKKQVADLEKRLEGREERIAKAEEQAKELEDKIYASNKPQPRKFVLKKVAPMAK